MLGNIATDRLAEDAVFVKKSSFQMKLTLNKQNCCIWGIENLHAYIEKPMHPKRVTFWCEFWSRGIIGTFFFENEQADEPLQLMEEKEEDFGDIWFQQDGATCNTAEVTRDVLR